MVRDQNSLGVILTISSMLDGKSSVTTIPVARADPILVTSILYMIWSVSNDGIGDVMVLVICTSLIGHSVADAESSRAFAGSRISAVLMIEENDEDCTTPDMMMVLVSLGWRLLNTKTYDLSLGLRVNGADAENPVSWIGRTSLRVVMSAVVMPVLVTVTSNPTILPERT